LNNFRLKRWQLLEKCRLATKKDHAVATPGHLLSLLMTAENGMLHDYLLPAGIDPEKWDACFLQYNLYLACLDDGDDTAAGIDTCGTSCRASIR